MGGWGVGGGGLLFFNSLAPDGNQGTVNGIKSFQVLMKSAQHLSPSYLCHVWRHIL